MDPFTMLTELCNALKSIGIKFKGVNKSSKGKAIGIVYTDGQRDDPPGGVLLIRILC
jgi:hypothetical protein